MTSMKPNGLATGSPINPDDEEALSAIMAGTFPGEARIVQVLKNNSTGSPINPDDEEALSAIMAGTFPGEARIAS